MKSLPVLAGALALAFASVSNAADKNFYLRDGDRVVFYGDSITDQRLYTTFTETYVVTRFPKMDVQFTHSGWGGDRVSGGGGGPIETRLQRDVFAYKPTVMTIMLGMNDASYRAFDQEIFNRYSTGYQKIVDMVKKEIPNIRMTLIQPSPFDDVTRKANFEGGYNNVLIRYGEFVKELAKKEGLDVADLNTAVVEATKKADAIDHENAVKLNQDRVHPGPGGQLLMAAELLKAWNAPSTVTWVEIDAAGKKVVRSDRTKISNVNGNLTWTQEDESLPMAIDTNDPVVALALKASDFTESLNQQMLKVTGVSGQQTLKIDGETVGTFSSEDLAKGVNLALIRTPMWKQAQDVHRLTLQHNELHFVRWRQVQVKVNADLENFDRALKSLDALEQDIVKQQRKAAQPKQRRFELTPAA